MPVPIRLFLCLRLCLCFGSSHKWEPGWGVSKTRTRGLFFNYYFFFPFCVFFFKTQTSISLGLHQQCIIAISSHIKEMKFRGAHLSGTSPQIIRVTFQSRQSNIEAAQISFLVQRRFIIVESNETKRFVLFYFVS